MSDVKFEATARKRGVGLPPLKEGMRRVVVGKVPSGWEDVDPIELYTDESGEFRGEVVHETSRRRFVDYPAEHFEAHRKRVEDEANARVRRSQQAGIANEVDSKTEFREPIALRELFAGKEQGS